MIITSPQKIQKRVFLAGSIENGAAMDWQLKAAKDLSEKGFIVLNPRRADWNPDWKQSITNIEFKKQVYWELNGLEMADFILFFFQPGTLSPITLLELGLFASSGKVVMVCPDGFWRKGNVEVVCEKFGIDIFYSIDEAIDDIIEKE